MTRIKKLASAALGGVFAGALVSPAFAPFGLLVSIPMCVIVFCLATVGTGVGAMLGMIAGFAVGGPIGAVALAAVGAAMEWLQPIPSLAKTQPNAGQI